MSGKMGRHWRLPPFLIVAVLAVTLTSGCARWTESEGIKPGVPERQEMEAEGAPPEEPAAGREDSEPAAGDAAGARERPQYEIFPGGGGVIGRPRRSLALATVEPGGDITLNFVDADIREVLKATLGGVLGANYVVGPQVQGTITVQSGRPVRREALLPTLETVLRLHGLALIREGATYRVEPLPGAARGNASIRLGMAGASEGDAYGIQVVPLNYVAATQMAETLRPIAREGSVLHIDQTRNLLILGGTRLELGALLEAVEIFDVNWLAGMSFGLFPLEVAQAKTLAGELTEILGDGRELLGGMVRVVPVERLNAVLAVSRQPRYLEEIRRWVERLDRVGAGGPERQLHIYFVQNGKASDLATVLSDVFGGGEPRPGAVTPVEAGALAPGLEPVEIRTTSTDPAEVIRQLQQQEAARSESASEQAEATGAPTPLTRPRPEAGARTQGIALSEGAQIRVVADDERNALLIAGTQAEYQSVLRALRQLDRRPLEVLIEATIADVQLSDRLEYGVRWFFQEGNHSVTLTDLASGAVAPGPPGLNYVFDVTNATAVLDLLATVTDVEVISAPQLLVLNNQEALLQVGDQVPVATQQSSTTPTAPDETPIVTSSIQLRDTGVILRVTPRVNDGGLVIMEIEQEVSQVNQEADTGTITPTISKRVINTTVAVESGRTVALGGLIRDSKNNTKVGVPVLSAIPFLGALFRYTTDVADRSELLVLVSPRVITNERESLAVTEELRRRMEDLERLESKL